MTKFYLQGAFLGLLALLAVRPFFLAIAAIVGI
jgi:hypothetical protein